MTDIGIDLSLAILLAVVAAVISGWTSLAVYRHSTFRLDDARSDLVRPFYWTTSVFTIVALSFPFVAWFGPEPAVGTLPLLMLISITVPWTVFALRYAGRGSLVNRRWVAVGSLLAIFILSFFVLQFFQVLPTDEDSIIPVVLSTVALLFLVVSLTAGGVVVLSTYRHGSFSLSNGLAVVAPLFGLLVGGQFVSILTFVPTTISTASIFLLIAAVFPLSVRRYDVLSRPPGIGALGERAGVDVMAEAFVVIDHRGHVVRANDRAIRLFGPDVEGDRLDEILEYDVHELDASDTIEVWTDRGQRVFDPRVASLDPADRPELGHTVTLLDVTDREIRQQRLQVLNRILRHNLRNELDVIQAHAELALDDRDDEDGDHLETISAVATDLDRMSTNARRIEKLMNDRGATGPTPPLDALVEDVVEEVTRSDRPNTIAVAVPSVELDLDPGLLRYAFENVIENAVEHGSESPPSEESENADDRPPVIEIRGEESDGSFSIVVADDGPGIPESERSVIESGVEHPNDHASSLGLWGTNWAVQSLGGDLSFGQSDLGGAAVRIDLPRTER